MAETIGPRTYWAIESLDLECGQWLEVEDTRWEDDAVEDCLQQLASLVHRRPDLQFRRVQVIETRIVHA